MALRHLSQPAVFFRSGSGAEEGVGVFDIVDGGDDPVVGAGEGTDAVQALVDAEAGLAEAGETVLQGGDVLVVVVVGWGQG